jgi:outer membrane protein assembly factor BamB
MSRPLALLAVLLLAAPAAAILNAPIKLQDIIDKLPSIFVAEVDAVDADKATAVFVPKDDLKGKAEFARIPVNLKDGITAAAKKADHTKVILERLAKGRKLILFVKKDGDSYSAWGFVEGTWFQLAGTADKDDTKTVRWAFLNCEPALRGTFKGTTDELRAVVADVVAGKAKAPAPDLKEKPGFGPTVEEEKKKEQAQVPLSPGGEGLGVRGNRVTGVPLTPSPSPPGERGTYTAGPLFGVIPSTVFVAPLAVLAAIFPATFGGLANGFRRWRAFMMVVSVNGILAAVYFFTQKLLPDQWWASPTSFTALLLFVVALGLLWAGRRYRAAVAADPAETDPPAWKDAFALLGFAAASVLVVFAVVYIGQWILTGSPFGLPFAEVVSLLFQLPTRELTAGIVGLIAAACYLGYRTTRAPEVGPFDRTRLAGESVALSAMLLFGGVMLTVGLPRSGPAATAALEFGDEDLPEGEGTGPDRRLLGGRGGLRVPVGESPIKLTDATVWYESPDVEEIVSGVALTPTHAYFGGMKDAIFRKGAIACIDRATGKQKWVYTDPELRTVYCTPLVAGGRVYCGEGLHTDPECRMLCLDAESGQKLWEFRTASHTEGTPAVADGRVYFSAGDDGLYCLTTEGAEVWHYRGKEQGLHVDTPVVLADGRVYAGSGYQSFAAFCLDAASGAEVWKKELPLRSFGPPVVSGDRVIFGIGTGALLVDLSTEPEPGRPPELTPAGGVLCLNAADGETVWKHDLDRSAHTQLAADGRAVYAASRDGWLYALDRGTGKRLWRFSYGEPLTTGTAAASYTKAKMSLAVYCVHPAGRVQAHDPLTGRLYWVRAVDQFTPREVSVSGPPAVEKVNGWDTREVFVPVTLTNKNNGDKRAAVVKFVDRLAE